jgi:glycosyltransferase involved in cell wall biosynthesis
VVVLHNVDSELTGVGAEAPRPPLRRVTSALERRLTARQERLLVRDPRALVVVVSERDRALLGDGAVVVPNGADLPTAVPERDPSGTALFVASMSYAPNREAVRWWAHDVWPHVTDGTPLTVVGHGAEHLSEDLREHAGVELIGEVDDVGPNLAKAAMVVVPLLSGGGSRLKILEAMAWKRPVVTTHKGVEGIPLVHRVSALILDDPQGIAEAIALLRSDRALADRLAGRAHELVQDFAWTSTGASFARACTQHSAAWQRG